MEVLRSLGGYCAVGFGALFAITGIVEFLSGYTPDDLVRGNEVIVPDTVENISHRLSKMPVITLCGGGSALITIGTILLYKKSS